MNNGSIPSAVPAASAASAVDRGNMRNEYVSAEDDNSTAAENLPDDVKLQPPKTPMSPDSPKSFNSEDIFDDVDDDEEIPRAEEDRITDQDLDRLLGPLPSRRTVNTTASNNNHHPSSLEVDNCSNDDWSREKKTKKPSSDMICPCCPSMIRRGFGPLFATSTKVGNVFILSPRCYNQFGFGVCGPHWFGPVCCFGLETIATIYYYSLAKNNVGMISAVICLLFYIFGIISLCLVACSDPGIVRSVRGGGVDGRGGLDGAGVGRNGWNGYAGVSTAENNITARAGWRYCDLCSVYQPPDAVHCPECNVCIEGYDHHCPWMGQCIGKKNFTSFMMFNCSWLFYLLYAIIWVTFLGQAGKYKHQSHPAAEFGG
ncbi:hypothetical protein ACHAXM_005199 [Skeletonema potamos]